MILNRISSSILLPIFRVIVLKLYKVFEISIAQHLLLKKPLREIRMGIGHVYREGGGCSSLASLSSLAVI